MSLSTKLKRAFTIALGKASALELDNLLQGSSDVTVKRTYAIGKAHTSAMWALSGGFGASASVAIVNNSNDSRFALTITSAGVGQALNPTATLTFADGAWTNAPFAVVCRAAGNQLTVPVSVTTTLTTLVITFLGTPVAAETYTITGQVDG